MELFRILGTIALSGQDRFNNDLDSASGKGKKLANVLGQGLATAAKVGAAAVGAAAKAVGVLMKSSISNYAEYEQLVGGAKLMFGDAYDYIAEKSANAYKNVQMSQNEYLQQANGFATGLKTALGGNEQAAAELTDRIITAEADVVAATGQTQEAVQNAFNGIMKSNYTMLDNLLLGITPTKEGFQELIDKVNDWNAASGKATDYQIDNLADAQNALVDYIEMVGVAGYAQNEAADTIQGSVASMKAAWQNFVTGLSDENADLGQLMDNLIDSAVTAGQNINTRLQVLLPRIVEGVTQLTNSLIPLLPEILNNILPGLLSEAVSFVNGLVAALPSLIDTVTNTLVTYGPTIIVTLTSTLLTNLPTIIQSGIQLLLGLVQGISQSLPQLIPVAVEAVGQLVMGLLSALPQVAMAALELATGLLDGIYDTLIASTGDVGTWIDETIVQPIRDWASNLLTVGAELADKLWEGIKSVATSLFPGLSSLFGDAASDAVATTGEAMQGAVTEAQTAAQNAVTAAAETVTSSSALIPVDTETPVSAMADIMANDMSMEEAGIEAVDRSASSMQSAVNTAGFDAAGKTAMQRFIQGINSMQSAVMNAVNSIASQAVARMQSALNQIQSMASSANVPGYATGLDYVPYDEFPALLHKGEAVLTASEAAAWRAGKNEAATPNVTVSESNVGASSGLTIIQNIQTVPQTPVEFAATTEAYFEQARWSMA